MSSELLKVTVCPKEVPLILPYIITSDDLNQMSPYEKIDEKLEETNYEDTNLSTFGKSVNSKQQQNDSAGHSKCNNNNLINIMKHIGKLFKF
jgi:hypothetical protein